MIIEVTPDHPDVVKAVKEATTLATSTVVVTEEMYMTALKAGIENAEEKKRERIGSNTWYVLIERPLKEQISYSLLNIIDLN